MKIPCAIVAVGLLGVVSCTRTPSPKTLSGEWRQDGKYFQSKKLMNRLAEIDILEEYEFFLTSDRFVATRIVGKEPDEQRVYWESSLTFTTDSAGKHQMTFNSHEGKPVTATVWFEGKHLIVQIGKRRMGFLKEPASNLRHKGYVPKS